MLVEKLEFENGLTIALWEMTESVDELLERLELDPFIMEKVFSFSSEKRRLEYLAVRVMVNEVCGSKKTIAYLPSGMPYLTDRSAQISITHTGRYAAIILHPTSSVGIDIERFTDKVARVRTKFLSEEELSSIDARTEKTHLAILWAAKEALYKIMGVETVDFPKHLHIEPFQPYMEGEINAKESCTEKGESYCLSYKVYPQFVMVWVKK